MRYPVTLIPGLPVTPDVGIGIALNPVPVAAPDAASGASTGGDLSPGVIWANVFTPDRDTHLLLELEAPTSGLWAAVAGNQVFNLNEIGGDENRALLIGSPSGVSTDAAITWQIVSVDAVGGTLHEISDTYFYVEYSDTLILTGIQDGRHFFVQLPHGSSMHDESASLELEIQCLADGEPIGTLRLVITT